MEKTIQEKKLREKGAKYTKLEEYCQERIRTELIGGRGSWSYCPGACALQQQYLPCRLCGDCLGCPTAGGRLLRGEQHFMQLLLAPRNSLFSFLDWYRNMGD